MGFDDTTILVCGRGEGGAVANAAVHLLNTTYNFQSVRGYTYGAPNVTSSDPGTEKKGNLFNFVYAYDAVGYSPKQFYKYGKTYYIGAKEGSPDSVVKLYERYTGLEYDKHEQQLLIELLLTQNEERMSMFQGIINAVTSIFQQTAAVSKTKMAHDSEMYLAWMMGDDGTYTMDISEIRRYYLEHQVEIGMLTEMSGVITVINGKKQLTEVSSGNAITTFVKTLSGLTDIVNGMRAIRDGISTEFNRIKEVVMWAVKCPVDVYVYDKDMALVDYFEDHALKTSDTQGFTRAWASGEDSDILAMPASGDYMLYIVGNGSGSMEVSGGIFGEEGTLECKDVTEEIPVEKGERFIAGYVENVDEGRWDCCVYSITRHVLYINGSAVETAPFTLPAALREISGEAFEGVNGLKGLVVLPGPLDAIGSNAFAGTDILAVDALEAGNDAAVAVDAFGQIRPIVLCVKGSAFEKWANENNIPCLACPR